MRKMLLLSAVVLLASAAQAFAASSICDATPGNLVLNCGFEGGTYSSTIGGFTNNSVPVDWVPNMGFDLEPSFNHVNSGNQHSGNFDLSIGNFDNQPLAMLSQTIATVSGDTYSGSFWAFDGGANGDPNAFLNLVVDGNVEVSLNDTVGAWSQFTFSFTGTGSDTLTIEAQTNPSEWYADDVVVTGASPVPEPSTFALLSGAGLVILAGMAHRKLFA